MTRVGLVADTHVGEYLDEIPAAALAALEGCDLILHAGDLSVPGVIDTFATIAPVVAVRGDHDRLDGLALPEIAVVSVAGRRIALIHGKRPTPIEWGLVIGHLAARRRIAWPAGLHRALLARAGPVDCLVYGHWHEPFLGTIDGTLVVSPGAVCPWGSLEGGLPPGPRVTGVIDRAVSRFRRQLGLEAMRPRLAILAVSDAGLEVEFVTLGPPVLPIA
ncbi:MAG: metallophosphoesterase family protein [Actinobacteria bacterium]|nr:metallophosphoesterase family protein [Actinomycetota bacterium]